MRYADYLAFFREQVQARGAQATVEWALPQLVEGLARDLLHPVIQLGYYYESQPQDLCRGPRLPPRPASAASGREHGSAGW